MIGRDGIAGLVCLVASLWLLAMSRGLPQPALVPIGPGFYPGLLFGVTAVLGAALVVSDVVGRRRAGRAAAGAPARAASGDRRYGLVAAAFALFGAYVAALPALGFRVSTLLFVGVLQAVIDPPRSGRRWLAVALVAAATTAATYLVFERYLTVLLPRGRLTGF